MAQVGRLGPKFRGHLALFLHSSREPVELSQCSNFKYDDSTKNIVQVLLLFSIIYASAPLGGANAYYVLQIFFCFFLFFLFFFRRPHNDSA